MTPMISLARAIHLISAFWTLGLAIVILIDVVGRGMFSQPLPGTKEIIQNSVVSITFLQLPLAVYSGSMLRTSIFADAVPPLMRKVVRTFSMLLGFAMFAGLLYSTWPSFVDAYRIGEYEGEGALRVPTWPVRGMVFLTSILAAYAYVTMIYLDWTNRLIDEIEAPGSIRPKGAN